MLEGMEAGTEKQRNNSATLSHSWIILAYGMNSKHLGRSFTSLILKSQYLASLSRTYVCVGECEINN